MFLVATAAAKRKLNAEEKLLVDLFDGYEILARPVPHPTNVTNVSFAMDFIRVVNFDLTNSVVKFNAWMSVVSEFSHLKAE